MGFQLLLPPSDTKTWPWWLPRGKTLLREGIGSSDVPTFVLWVEQSPKDTVLSWGRYSLGPSQLCLQ